ncbi:pentapeptide repeat-containing protein [Streptomyces avicenniae]|uniref:pentapeptide repeat-containing protein n=1 Tax=Streptomyces avicenniae TaxID=500153 RepID=UPI0006998657|nr:pentapeptide repeat-containing protein [Streptomyces avicenniae]
MTTPPPWPHCGRGAGPDDPVGCRGICVGGHTACLVHLADADRTAHLAALAPGADLDHRGTTFTPSLLRGLVNASRTMENPQGLLGNCRFEEATFAGDAAFGHVTFGGDARFGRAVFQGEALFSGATFARDAGFDGAVFARDAAFGGVTFGGDAVFRAASFAGHALFGKATFQGDAVFAQASLTRARFWEADFRGDALFLGAEFGGDAVFVAASFAEWAAFERAAFRADVTLDAASFAGDAVFGGARFEATQRLGPLVGAGRVVLDGALFGAPVTLELAAAEVSCVRTRWESTATLRLRHATVDLTDAVLAAPIAVTAHPAPFTREWTPGSPVEVGEAALAGRDDAVRVASVRGVDAALLVLNGTDLSNCLFAGAFHLDQIRMEGRTRFDPPPRGQHHRRLLPLRWARRRTLAEEHHWRAAAGRQPFHVPGRKLPSRAWRPGPHHPDPGRTPGPEALAATYRQLRKAFEDAKDEPGAADFYYGECEMRRHDRTGTTPAERGLLAAYWALSGYGLRASRAMCWLLLLMTVTVLAMMLWGLPGEDPKPVTAGRQVEAGRDLSLTTDTPPPVNPTGPLADRLTTARFEKALRVVINSTVFRSSGQNLTTAGTYTEMASRLTEPLLLGLAVLAVRGRIKR